MYVPSGSNLIRPGLKTRGIIALTRDPQFLKIQVVPNLLDAVWADLLYCHRHASRHPYRLLCMPTSGGESVGPILPTHRRCKFPEQAGI